MKRQIATLAFAGIFLAATAALAQTELRKAPQAQQVDEPKTVPAAENTGVSKAPVKQETTVTTQETAPAQPVTGTYVAPPPPPAPAPVERTETTGTTTYNTLPKTASPYPSMALGGIALLAAAALVRRKRR